VCGDFARDPRASKFNARLAALRAEQPALERDVARHLLDLYRQQRRLPAGPLAALVSRQTRAQIICRGELEHVLGLSKIIPRVRDFVRRLGSLLRRS
jgi:hypothetical protein